MNPLHDREYYLAREQRERAIAENSMTPAIADIHLEMAKRYAELAEFAKPPLPRRRLSIA